MSRLGQCQIPGELYKSYRPLHSALVQGVPTRCARHRSPCMHTAKARLDTYRTWTPHANLTPIGRAWPYLDAGPHIERSRDMHKIDAVSPDDTRRPLNEYGICELLGHGANQRHHTSQPEAKNTHRSNLPVAGHDLWPAERPREAYGGWRRTG